MKRSWTSVTILYGPIHRSHEHHERAAAHYAARSQSVAFRDPALASEKKPILFDDERPFKNLWIRFVREGRGGARAGAPVFGTWSGTARRPREQSE